METGTKLTRK